MATTTQKPKPTQKLVRFSEPAIKAIQESHKRFLADGLQMSETAVINALVTKGANQVLGKKAN